MVESRTGRAFEVTPGGDRVWEFYGPHRTGENEEFVAAICRTTRLAVDFPINWVHGPEASAAD